jgi:hypothetical protein
MMDTKHEVFLDIIDFLRNCDLAYAFKKKRLRHLQCAAVDKEIQNLRTTFHELWIMKQDRYLLKNPSVSGRILGKLSGILGSSDEASALLDSDRAMVILNLDRFRRFLEERISSDRGRAHLFELFCGEWDSMRSLAEIRIPFLEKYIPVIGKFERVAFTSLAMNRHEMNTIIHVISRMNDIADNLSKDVRCYNGFMKDFRRMYRESASVDIVGYGEISTVLRLKKKGWVDNFIDVVTDDSRLLWKKLPPFPSSEAVRDYENLYYLYRKVLVENVGIDVPEQVVRYFKHEKHFVVYAGQARLEENNICHRVIHRIDEENAYRLIEMILDRVIKVHEFNQKPGLDIMIGFDAQLSNWALVPAKKDRGLIDYRDGLYYIDTSSPLVRIKGVEQINTEIFIKSAASFLRPIIRTFFLRDVVDRYYDTRRVLIDLIANLYKEQCPRYIDGSIELANRIIRTKELQIAPIVRKEIDGYYSSDAFIWRFYQASRKIDRFITEKILRKKYEFRIPGPIER